MAEYYPNIAGLVDPRVEQAIRLLYQALYATQTRAGSLEGANFLSQSLAEAKYGGRAMRKKLSSSGEAPLYVGGLLGVLLEPQMAGVPRVAVLPILSDPLSQEGSIVALAPTLALYRFDGSVSPGVWRAIAATGVLQFGLRAATPAPGNAGYMYYQTDTGWLYYDNGTNYLYLCGIGINPDATRLGIAGIGANDNGALFFTTDTAVIWRVSGGAWVWYYGLPASDGSLFKHGRVSTGAIPAGTDVAVTLAWGTAFADANYTVSAEVVEAVASAVTLRVHHVESVAAASVVVRIVNDDGANARTGVLNVIAVHDA